jgi:hypothetical protein
MRSSIKAKGKASVNNENKAESKRGKKYIQEERGTSKGVVEKTISPFGITKKKKATISSKIVESSSRPREMIMSMIIVSLFLSFINRPMLIFNIFSHKKAVLVLSVLMKNSSMVIFPSEIRLLLKALSKRNQDHLKL